MIAMATSYEIPDFAKQLVLDGIITVNVIFTRTGQDVWARSVLPHPKLGVNPNESYEVDEICELLKKVRVSSNPTPAKGKGKSIDSVSSRARPGVDSFSEVVSADKVTLMSQMTVKQARGVIQSEGLDQVTRKGVRNILPKTSLVIEEMSRSAMALNARCIVVADAIGSVKAMNRISASPSLRIRGVRNLQEWWNAADVMKRVEILSNAKALNMDRLTPDRARSIGLVPCPFRGSEDDMGFSTDEEGILEYQLSAEESDY